MRTNLYSILGPWPGRLSIMPRPRGGDWLADEIQSWRQAGVDVIVSLLEPDEIADLDLFEEAGLSWSNGIEYISFPITDRSVPSSIDAVLALATNLAEKLGVGKNVAVHCRQGVGRAALIAICVLVLSGIDADDAIKCVGAARVCTVPETMEQRKWVEAFARMCMNDTGPQSSSNTSPTGVTPYFFATRAIPVAPKMVLDPRLGRPFRNKRTRRPEGTEGSDGQPKAAD